MSANKPRPPSPFSLAVSLGSPSHSPSHSLGRAPEPTPGPAPHAGSPQAADTSPALDRLRLVLGTRRGTLPWRPELGLTLDDLVGEPLTPAQLTRVRHRLGAALALALPDARVQHLELHVRRRRTSGAPSRDLPVAERALVPFGAAAELVAELTLLTPDGLHHVSVDLTGSGR